MRSVQTASSDPTVGEEYASVFHRLKTNPVFSHQVIGLKILIHWDSLSWPQIDILQACSVKRT